MKREIIIEMPKTYGEYRVVCRFGYDSIVNYAWWTHLQKQALKRPLLWGRVKKIWVEVDRGWWSRDIETMDELKKCAEKIYDENIEMPKRIQQKAMTL